MESCKLCNSMHVMGSYLIYLFRQTLSSFKISTLNIKISIKVHCPYGTGKGING